MTEKLTFEQSMERLEQIARKLEQYAQWTQECLEQLLPPQEGDRVTEAMRYSLLAGGKRLRAALALEFCRVLCGDAKRALTGACALEMVHAYSLIHDDLPCMDDDEMRRGKPSCHIAFGEAVALLAGDGLLTKAFEVLAASEELDAQQRADSVLLLAKAAGHQGMIGGQRMDLENETFCADIERVRRTDRLKTGELICAAAQMGCIAAKATAEQMQAAQEYAHSIGLAFQITDDILDCVGDAEQLGKPTGSDEENHKTTYVSVYGVQGAAEQAQQQVLLAKQALPGLGKGKNEEAAAFLYRLADYILIRKN